MAGRPLRPVPVFSAGLTRARSRILVDLIALLAFLVSYLVIPVRLGHLTIGYGLAVVVLVHLAQHGPATMRAFRGTGQARRRAITDVALFVLVALTTASGAWQQANNTDGVRNWHSTLGTAALLLALGHAWRRRQALASWRRRARGAGRRK
jgi:hypothetical protein